MLKLIRPEKNNNRKTGKIASTYRVGSTSIFGSCPKTCKLCPKLESAADRIDEDYLDSVYKAVPKGGVSFTYSHFPWKSWYRPHRERQTVINFSTESVQEALESVKKGVSTVMVGAKDSKWPQKIGGVRFVACPANVDKGITCQKCGGGRPLCARPERDYVIVFPAHGAGKGRVLAEEPGGCYASTGPISLAWRGLLNGKGIAYRESQLESWVATLPEGSIIRHHIAGDLGYG